MSDSSKKVLSSLLVLFQSNQAEIHEILFTLATEVENLEEALTEILDLPLGGFTGSFGQNESDGLRKAQTIASDVLNAINEPCSSCGGEGWIPHAESAHGCDGTEESCSITCPVLEWIQIQCPDCIPPKHGMFPSGPSKLT